MINEEPISLLFVDDDEQWANYIAGELEAEDPEFDVRIALNANEAIVALEEDRSIDCVVTDFQMPEIDGIEMLEHVRSSRPHLPFILVTGTGSEDVAARAINAGITDYVQKDPRVNQAPILANRIRQAVERSRLRTEVRESERRYRTVIEHTHDALVILRGEEIVFANDRFKRLCELGEIEPPIALFRHVHEDDHESVRDLVEATRSEPDPELREVRLLKATGEVRHCELSAASISYEGERATLLSIRDVTRRRSRERTLKREREFNQAVQKRLVGAHTRAELETEIAKLLSSYGYDLVWIGTVDERGVHTRATAGDGEFIERLEGETAESDHGGDPILWSARSGDAQFVPDFEALMPTDRRNDALECGFRTAYAIPLRHEGISYGTLAAYRRGSRRIDEAERSLLAEVAETVSFAIHHVETRQTLTDAAGVVVEVDLEPGTHYLQRIVSERFTHPAPEITVNGTRATGGDAYVQYLSVSSSSDAPDAFADALREQPSVRAPRVIDDGEPTTYQVSVEDDTPESLLGSVGALVRSTVVSSDLTTVTFELASRERLQPVIDRLNERYGPVTIRSVVGETRRQPRERTVRIGIDSLTDKQLIALEAAYHYGYFDRPRRHSAVEIAESLDITHTMYLQHLRTAERKLFRQLFGGTDVSTNGRAQ